MHHRSRGLAAATENYLRQGLSRATGGNNARSFALQTPVLSSYPCLVDERLFHWSTKQSADGPRRLQQFQLLSAATTSVGFISGKAHTAASAYLMREIPTAYHFSWNAPFWLVTFT